jgi:phospholipase C
VFTLWPARGPEGPWFYTVGAGEGLAASHPIGPDGYDLIVHGPNGFLRGFKGHAEGAEVEAAYDVARKRLLLTLRSPGRARRLTIFPVGYPMGAVRTYTVPSDGEVTAGWSVAKSVGWYDLLVVDGSDDRTWSRQLTGRIELGRPSVSDPAIGADALPVGLRS